MLAWPGAELATAAVYAGYRAGGRAAERVAELAPGPFATDELSALAGLVENDLTTAAEALCPAIAALRVRLLGCGAKVACMSGSGSAVFGLFAAEDAARAARKRLFREVPWSAVARLPHSDAGARITA